MKLHRTTGQADWANITPNEYNGWQKLAAATGSLVTPGNLITLMGLILVLAALAALLAGHGWLAIIGLALGRLLDLADGLAAEATGTKSPLGEAMDATVDKIGTGLTLVAAGLSGAISWPFIGLLAAPHVLIAIIVVTSRIHGRKFHPSRLGKLSMAVAWVGMLGLIGLHASGLSQASVFGFAAYAVSLASIVMGFIAAAGYFRNPK